MNTEMIDKLTALKKPTVKLQLHDGESNSKFGGFPSVESDGFQWPTFNGNPLAFVGQIDLAEMSLVFHYDWLPSTGYLLFFYDLIERCTGADPTERESWRVIYQENPDTVARYPDDIDAESKLEERCIIGSLDSRLPPHGDHIHIPGTEYSISSKEEFNQLSYMKIDEYEAEKPYHQFGGYPTDPNFCSLRLDAQLALSGLEVYYSIDLPSLTDERIQQIPVAGSCVELYASDAANKIKAGADDWALLLQIDTDEKVSDEFVFGDGDKLFFYVQMQKAKEKNFTDCWLFAERLY